MTHDCSYGFRPGKSCHDAIKDLHKYLFKNNVSTIIDVDLADYFNTIDHDTLIAFLRIKITDNVFMRYIVRMLKAGVLTKGEFSISEEGVPQGSICSPVLANIIAHYVIDEWFEEIVKKLSKGKVQMFRYADDIVICCEFDEDALKIKRSLNKRLVKYKLRMNEEKTKIVAFSSIEYSKGMKQGTFDFLGFTFYLARSKKGFVIPKLKTKKKSFRNKLKRVKEWIYEVKDKADMKTIWKTYCSKLRGHIQYYGVSFNIPMVSKFIGYANSIIFKGLNKRSQKRSFDWESFNKFIQRYPHPNAHVTVKLF